MKFDHPTLRVATSEAELETGLGVECQVTSALVQAQPNYQQIPATGCAPAAQSPGRTGWQLVLNYLQDWTAGEAASLSWFLYDNDGAEVWFQLDPDTTTSITGNGYAVAGDFGGTFADGSAAVATSTWPLLDKPAVVIPA
jgi:hypothetical protein